MSTTNTLNIDGIIGNLLTTADRHHDLDDALDALLAAIQLGATPIVVARVVSAISLAELRCSARLRGGEDFATFARGTFGVGIARAAIAAGAPVAR